MLKTKMIALMALLLSLCAVSAAVVLTDVDNSEAAVTTGSCGTNCTYSLDGTVLTISGTGAMTDYTESNPANWGGDFDTLVVSEGVTSIGSYAFLGSDCAFLENVTLADSVKSVGKCAFEGAPLLNFKADGIETIADSAFNGSMFTSFNFDNVVSIGVDAFYNSSLQTITFGNSGKIVTIADCAFGNCSALQRVILHESATLGAGVFTDCTALTAVYATEAAYSAIKDWPSSAVRHDPAVSVSFDSNGGVGSIDSQTVKVFTSPDLTVNGVTREGHTFVGWATSAGALEPLKTLIVSENVTLYAVWTSDPVTPEVPETPADPEVPLDPEESEETAEETTAQFLGVAWYVWVIAAFLIGLFLLTVRRP